MVGIGVDYYIQWLFGLVVVLGLVCVYVVVVVVQIDYFVCMQWVGLWFWWNGQVLCYVVLFGIIYCLLGVGVCCVVEYQFGLCLLY